MGAAEKIEIETQALFVSSLVPFPRNPRTVREDDPKVLELAASMKAHGQLTPIVVRTVDDGETWQTLAGNRRRVAGGIAELDTLRAEIRRDLDDDDDAFRYCLTSQIQHEDLAPLEEADALHDLMFSMGPRTTMAQLASAVGKSEKHVRERLSLRGIVDEIRAMASSVDLGALQALASLSHVAQGRIAKRLAKVLEQDNRITRTVVSRIIETENVTRSLATVTWDLADADLVATAGACNVCPKRTGQGALVDDVVAKDDVCLDDGCYADKGAAQWDRTAATERDHGAKVLSLKESARVLEHGRPKPDSGYVAASEKVMVGDKQVRVENLLSGTNWVAPVVMQDPETMGAVRAFQRKDVDAAVKAARAKADTRVKKPTATGSAAKVDPKRAAIEEKERERQQIETATEGLLLETAVLSLTMGDLSPALAMLRMVLGQIGYEQHAEVRIVAARRGLTKSDQFNMIVPAREALQALARKYAKANDEPNLLRLGYELFVAAKVCELGDKELKAELGLDRPRAMKDAARQLTLAKAPAAPKLGGTDAEEKAWLTSKERPTHLGGPKKASKPKKGTARK